MDFESVTEKIISEKVEDVDNYLPPSVLSSRWLPGWRVTGLLSRASFRDRGQVLVAHHQVYSEKKKVAQNIGKKAQKRFAKQQAAADSERHPYHDDRFMPWQNRLAESIHRGDHVIVDVTTSCGKTWATSLIVAYETLSTDDGTCIFVSPNSEILRENVAEIRSNNLKHYLSSSKRMLDTQTRSYCTYDDKVTPICQIMCLTADNFVSFITNELNRKFIENLKYIVFDEVHMSEVSATAWWSGFLPQSAQFILLSATLGDIKQTVEVLEKISSKHEITVINYNIRPIPLQRVLFKGCPDPVNGYRCSTLKGAKRLSCQVNPFDPTPRDMKSLDKTVGIPESRENQYRAGQKLISCTRKSVLEKAIIDQVDDAVVEPTAHNIYNLLCYLFSNGMQPALVFNTSSAIAQQLAKDLVAHISTVEDSDPEFKLAEKAQSQLDRSEKRVRDKKTEDDWTKMPEEETNDLSSSKLSIIAANLSKWKFPSQFGKIPDNIPLWIQECLHYGIGVYLHSFPAWLRYKMFDAFKDGKLQVMIADPSISVGINLPVRTCILCGEDMTPALYTQMGGRAGRRGYDNQGYIIPMFNKEKIKECLLSEVSPVSIAVPSEMSYTELIRLKTPGELATFYNGQHLDDLKPPGTTYSVPPTEVLSASDSELSLSLKEIILSNYYHQTSRPVQNKIEQQIKTIRGKFWHYHRLTNLIQALPYSETMIFMQLLVNGDLQELTADLMIDLMGFLFERKEAIDIESSITLPPEILSKVLTYSRMFAISLRSEMLVSNYFPEFCKKAHYVVEDIDQIEKVGEWLYILKKYITEITPVQNPFRRVVLEVDEKYMIACKITGLVS